MEDYLVVISQVKLCRMPLVETLVIAGPFLRDVPSDVAHTLLWEIR